MRLKNFRTKQFAGIRNRDYDFGPGINILYGKNEAGKTTTIEAIYAALFKESKLHKSRERDFINRFFPGGSLDYAIDSAVTFELGGEDYQVERIWDDGMDSLQLPTGKVIKDPRLVEDRLRELLVLGQAAYKNLLFSSQEDEIPFVARLGQSEDLKGEISDIINRELMELDGMSMEKFHDLLEAEIASYSSNWDRQKRLPQSGRGIDNPYVRGVGQVLAAYYDLEKAKRDMNQALAREKSLEEAGSLLKEKSDRLDEIRKAKAQMDEVSEDVRKRREVELELKDLARSHQDLGKVVKLWPVAESRYKVNLEEIKKIEEEIRSIDQLKKNNERLGQRLELEKLLNSLDAIYREGVSLNKSLQGLGKLSREKVDYLINLDLEISKLEASLGASNLEAKLRSKGQYRLYNAKGHPIEGSGLLMDFGPSIRLETADLEFEVSIAGQDTQALNRELADKKAQMKNCLKIIKAESSSQAQRLYQDKQTMNSRLESLRKEYARLLGDRDLSAIREQIAKDRELEFIQPPAEELYQEKQLRLRKLEVELKVDEKDLVDYQRDHSSQELLLEKVSQLSSKIQAKEEELKSYKPLPEKYDSSEEFFALYKDLNKDYEIISNQHTEAKIKYIEAENQLDEVPYEEQKMICQDLELNFNEKEKKLERLEKIKRIFYETRDRMVDNPMAGLRERLSAYLDRITSGSVEIGDFDSSMELVLKGDLGEKDYIHLSQGTKETLALALRLAIVEEIFQRETFIFLDDIMTDLDPDRRKVTVEIIKEFAERNQVFYATADPSVAQELGGRLIEIA